MGFTDLRICPKFLPISVFIKLIFTSKHIQHYKIIFLSLISLKLNCLKRNFNKRNTDFLGTPLRPSPFDVQIKL